MAAEMLMDPCHAHLSSGFYSTSEGVLSKLKTVYSPSAAGQTGYIFWDAAFCSDIAQKRSNSVFFANSDANIAPVNTTGLPFGIGTVSSATNGTSPFPGGAAFASSPTVADQRCVGACLQMTYFGRMDAASGQVATFTNLPAEALFGADGVSLVTVNQLFSHADNLSRVSLDPLEINFRPTEYSQFFKNEVEGPIVLGTTGASVSSSSEEAKRFGSRYIGFAWKNVTTADLSFQFYQNLEWRPNVTSGFVTRSPVQVHTPGWIESVVQFLDDVDPGWQTKAKITAMSATTAIARMALGGSPGNRIMYR